MIKVKDMKKKVRMKNEKLEIKLADLSNIALLSMFQFKKMMEQETDMNNVVIPHWYCLTILIALVTLLILMNLKI